MLKEVSWEAIRRERFFLTPKGLFGELVRNAQQHLRQRTDESSRRQARLKACTETIAADVCKESPSKSLSDVLPPPVRDPDIFGLKLDELKQKKK